MAGQDFTVSIVGTVTGFDVAPVNNLSNSLKTIPPAANQAASAGQQLGSSLNQVSATSRTTGSSFQATGAMANAFGSNINTASGSARTMVGANSALGSSFGGVASGGLNANNALVPLGQNLQQTSTHANTARESSIGLGEKIALMGGFVTTAVGQIFGLVEGFTGLEAAQVAADRAQQRVNTSELAAEKAQDNYNKMVARFGPESRQAQEALANLTNKQEANRIAEERSEVTAKKLQEAYVSYGLEIVSTVGELATMGSTISILLGKLGLKTAATVVDTEANIANGASGGVAAAGLAAEGAAATEAAIGTEAAEGASAGLAIELAAIIAPIIAVAAAFILIETNTFGMGDAFRSVLPTIGDFIDRIINGFSAIRNSFVELGNSVEATKAVLTNVFIGIYNALASAYNDMILAGRAFVQAFENDLKTIYNFFVNSIVNPIIGAWNQLNLALETGWAITVNKIKGLFAPLVVSIAEGIKRITEAFALIPGAGDVFKKISADLGVVITDFNKTGETAEQTAKRIQDGFVGVKAVKLLTIDTQKLSTDGLLPLINTYANVNAAAHTYDSELLALNSTTGKQIAASADYLSHQENLSKVVTAQVVPAFRGAFGAVQEWTGGLIAGLIPQQKDAEAKTKITGETVKATKAQKDYVQTLADSIGKIDQEAAGIQKAIAAHQFQAKAIAETSKALQDAASKQQEFITKLTDGTAVQNRYNTAIIEGTNKYLDLIIKTQDAATTQQQYNDLLERSGSGMAALALGLDDTAKNMELVAKAALGDTEAFKELQGEVTKLYDNFNKLGDQVSSKLVDSLDKGKKAWKKSIKELSDETGVSFKQLGEDIALKVDAGLQKANKTLDTDLGVMAILIRQHAPNIGEATNEMIDQLSEQIKGAQPDVIAAWNKIFADMRKIAAEPIPTAASLGQLQKDMEALHLPADQVNSIMGQMKGSITGVGTAAGGATTGITQYSNGLAAAADLNAGFSRGVSDAIGQLNILQQAGATTFINFIPALAAVAAAMNEAFVRGVGDAIGQLNILQTAAGAVFITIVAGLEQVVIGFNVGFNQAVVAAATALNALTANVDANAALWITAFNAVATAMVTDFNGATKAVGTVLNGLSTNVNGNTQNWIKAFNAAATALTNDFNTGTRNAGTAMNSLSTNVNGNVNNIVSSLNRVVGMFNNIRSSIDSARSAVQSLINSINSIPTSKTVTVHIIQDITQRVHTVPVLTAGIGGTLTTTRTTGATSANTTTTTTLTPGIVTSPAGRRIIVEVREPTIIKIDSRELIKLINKRLLELDIGALL